MVRYTLEDLTKELATKPQLAETFFTYHASNGRYGPNAVIAIGIPETARSYAQNTAVATAKAAFDAERRNPTANNVLLNTYLPDYNREKNEQGWNRGKNIAIGMAGLGAAFLLWSFVADAETARKIGRVAGVATEAGAGVRLLRDYFRYRA